MNKHSKVLLGTWNVGLQIVKKFPNFIFHWLYLLLNWHMGHHFRQFCNIFNQETNVHVWFVFLFNFKRISKIVFHFLRFQRNSNHCDKRLERFEKFIFPCFFFANTHHPKLSVVYLDGIIDLDLLLFLNGSCISEQLLTYKCIIVMLDSGTTYFVDPSARGNMSKVGAQLETQKIQNPNKIRRVALRGLQSGKNLWRGELRLRKRFSFNGNIKKYHEWFSKIEKKFTVRKTPKICLSVTWNTRKTKREAFCDMIIISRKMPHSAEKNKGGRFDTSKICKEIFSPRQTVLSVWGLRMATGVQTLGFKNSLENGPFAYFLWSWGKN